VIVATVFATVQLALLPVEWSGAQDTVVPAPVVKKRDELRAALESTLQIEAIVSSEEARPSLVRIFRAYDRAAKSWQVDPAALAELRDDQIADFVVYRAQHVVSCTAALWTRVSLADAALSKESLLQFQTDMAPDGVQGPYRVGPNCTYLFGQDNEAVTLRSPKDVLDVLAYDRRFAQSVAPRVAGRPGLTREKLFVSNAAYFEQEFAAALAEERGFAQALRRTKAEPDADVRVFRFSMANLMLYLRYDTAGRARLIFMAPFSW
jgi:hypothetical protein